MPPPWKTFKHNLWPGYFYSEGGQIQYFGVSFSRKHKMIISSLKKLPLKVLQTKSMLMKTNMVIVLQLFPVIFLVF